MSWTDLSEREKYVSLKRTLSVLFIGLMAWPRRWRFKHRSAGEVKAFKCLASRKGIASLVKCKRSYSNLRKVSNPSRNSQKAVSLGKGMLFHPDLKWRYSGRLEREAIQTRSYPNAKLPRIANLHDSSANLFQSKSRVESEAELNHYSDVRISHIINQNSSKYFGVWTIPLQTYENFEGGLVDTLKKTRFLTGLNNV